MGRQSTHLHELNVQLQLPRDADDSRTTQGARLSIIQHCLLAGLRVELHIKKYLAVYSFGSIEKLQSSRKRPVATCNHRWTDPVSTRWLWPRMCPGIQACKAIVRWRSEYIARGDGCCPSPEGRVAGQGKIRGGRPRRRDGILACCYGRFGEGREATKIRRRWQ